MIRWDDYGDVLKPEEVAEILGVSKGLIYAELRRGAIPHVRIGERRYRTDKAELMEYVKSKKFPSAGKSEDDGR